MFCKSLVRGMIFTACLSHVVRTPFTILVPTRVTRPLRLSDRNEDRTRMEAFSLLGARRAAHSSRPSLSDLRVSWSCVRSHSSSRAYVSKGQIRSPGDRLNYSDG